MAKLPICSVFSITYEFENRYLTIKLNEHGYVYFQFEPGLREGIDSLIQNASVMHAEMDQNSFSPILNHVTALAVMKKQLRRALDDLFEESSEVVYIPAGRSLLATLSEQLQTFSIFDMDLTMQEFILLIRNTKSKFGSKIPNMVNNYTNSVKGQINNASVEKAYQLIRNILKTDYISDSDGEKIHFDERHWVKLMYGSSGQQEALWILMLCFVTILENKKLSL